MKERKNIILTVNKIKEIDLLRRAEPVRGILLGTGTWFWEGLGGVSRSLRDKAEGMEVILNTRWTFWEKEDRESVAYGLKEVIDNVDAMTVIGIISAPREDATAFGGKVYYVIDEANMFHQVFARQKQISFAREAQRCKCKGVIMTAKYPQAIGMVRKAVGRDFRILSTLEDGNEIGDGVRAGADTEILSVPRWRKLGTKLKE